MNKTYISTRNHQDQINFYQAIVQGIGNDGGLLVPNFDFQKLDLNKLVQLNYVDLATEVISTFVPEDGKELIHQACLNAYGKGLFPEIVVPVKKQEMFMLLNYSMDKQQHLKIWLYLFYHI